MSLLVLRLALGIDLEEKSALGWSYLSVRIKVSFRDRVRGEKRFGVVLAQCHCFVRLALRIGLAEKSTSGWSSLSVSVCVKVRFRVRVRGEKRYGVVLSPC